MTAGLKRLKFNSLSLSSRARLLFPIARMALAPLLHPRHILTAAEVITVAWLAQPATLTGLLAGGPAWRFGTINLMITVAVIGQEKLLTTTALAAAVLGVHGRANNGRKNSPCTPKKSAEEDQRRRRKKRFKRRWRRKQNGKKMEFQTASFPPFSFRRSQLKVFRWLPLALQRSSLQPGARGWALGVECWLLMFSLAFPSPLPVSRRFWVPRCFRWNGTRYFPRRPPRVCFNPNGIGSFSPRLARLGEGLPWVVADMDFNPEGVESQRLRSRSNPFRVVISVPLTPGSSSLATRG